MVGQHLGAQRGEALIALRAAVAYRRNPQTRAPWVHHPAARMWRGYERALCEYGLVVCREWRRRGYADQCLTQFLEVWRTLPGPTKLPPWWGRHTVHESHQRSMVRRYSWYRLVWPGVEPGDIAWPVPYGARTADEWEASPPPILAEPVPGLGPPPWR